MSINVDSAGAGGRVSLSGEMTIYNVAQIKATLAEAMRGYDEIEVDLAGIGDIDTAGLQLMLIAKGNPDCAVRFVNHSQEVLRLVDLANLGSALGDPLFICAS
jgi:anti-sigma B factor antagonist